MKSINPGYENLAHEIVVQACKDYRAALKRDDEQAITKIEKFFRSEWYRMLTSIDGEYLISKLRKEQKK